MYLHIVPIPPKKILSCQGMEQDAKIVGLCMYLKHYKSALIITSPYLII